MTIETTRVFEAALALPEQDRQELANQLIESVFHTDPELEDKWAREIETRIQSIRDGTAELIDEKDVYAGLDED